MQEIKEISCEFCERKAKYIVKVSSIYYGANYPTSQELERPRCAYHKNSSKRHYETEYNSFKPIGVLQ